MDYFLNNVNRSVGENMRFVRQFNANPESFIENARAQHADNQGNGMDSMGSMILLMLFQMMSQMMTQMGGGLPQTSYPPYLPPPNPAGIPPQIAQNPAYAFLEQLFRNKADSTPTGTPIQLSDADMKLIRDSMGQNLFTISHLGQSLKFQLDQAPDSMMPAVGRVMTDLMDSGELNAAPFLANDYLTKLSPERRQALLTAVETAGLRMDDNRPNARFIGFILENLDRADQPLTQAFLRQFLQDFYDVHGQTPDTPVGKILQQVLELAGVTANAEKKLVFSV